MLEKVDIYSYESKLVNAEKALDKLSKKNKELLLRFKNYLFLKNLSKPRILKYLGFLKNMGLLIEKGNLTQNNEFEKLTKHDIEMIVGTIQQKPYSPWTKHGYKIIIKQFIKWVKNCEENEIPDEVKWIKASVSRSETKLPGEGDLITKEEVDKAINSCNFLRDKALLSIVYESGCRIGELGSLRIGNILFDKYGAQIHVLGKTGARNSGLKVISTEQLV